MEIQLVPLGSIDPNPYQTRSAEDPDHIQNLAASIAAEGLLQVPSGRRRDGRIQLAFGHSRLAAYRHLSDAGTPGFETMPVNIIDLDDEGMFRAAVVENHDRKDLSAIDQALAMKVYRDVFGKTSEQIGELFHLSDSAVRNKIRLLGLPDYVQEGVSAGRITEGAARALIPWFEIPDEIRHEWEKSVYETNWDAQDRARMTDKALAGEIGPDEIARQITRMQQRNGEDLSKAWWKYDDELKSTDVQSLTCRSCPLRRDNKCLDRKCYKEKDRIYRQNYLYLASHLLHLPELEADRAARYEHTRLIEEHYYQQTSKEDDHQARTITKSGCDNLRVAFDGSREPMKDSAHPLTEYPRAMIVCKNRSGSCRCMMGLAAMQKEKEVIQSQALNAADLRKAAADQFKERREDNQTAIVLMDLAADLLSIAAGNYEDRALQVLISGNAFESKTLKEAIHQKAKMLVSDNLQYMTLNSWLARVNKILAGCGLPLLSAECAGWKAEDLIGRLDEISIPQL